MLGKRGIINGFGVNKMNTIIFDLDYSSATHETRDGKSVVVFKVPTLPAYAIEHSDFLFNGLGSNKEGDAYVITGNEVFCEENDVEADDVLRLIIYYHGIRDYRLLFPSIANAALVERLASFYEEAEKNFNNATWLSYALMCGAIYEGLLFDKLAVNKSFANLINSASTTGLIDTATTNVMTKARNFRNLVHASRFGEVYVSRADAMDMRTTIDKLIKKF
jgi:hypothetical protein